MLLSHFKSFLRAEDGAVTVDFVVLTAATVGLGIATLGVVSGGIADASQDIDTQMSGQIIVTEFTAPLGFASQAPFAEAWSEAVICAAGAGGAIECSGGGSGTTEYFNMSDGTMWSRATVRRGGETTITWKNGDGEEVAVDDVPELPQDLPMADIG